MGLFGGHQEVSKLVNAAIGDDLDEEAFEKLMSIFEEQIPAYEKMIADYEAFRVENGKLFNKTKIAATKKAFVDSYKKLKEERLAETPAFDYVHRNLHKSLYGANREKVFYYVRFCITGSEKGLANKNPINVLEKDKTGKNYLIGEAGKELEQAYRAYEPYAAKREAQISEEKEAAWNRNVIQRSKEEEAEIRKAEIARNKTSFRTPQAQLRLSALLFLSLTASSSAPLSVFLFRQVQQLSLQQLLRAQTLLRKASTQL